MNKVFQAVPAAEVMEDASTFTRFINIVGDISQTMYLATHPEENDQLPVQFATKCDPAQGNEYPSLYAPCHADPQEAYL